MSSQLLQLNPLNKTFIEGLIMSKVYTQDNEQYINIHNHRLDFSGKFKFLGFTKAGNKIKLSDDCSSNDKSFYASLFLDEFHHVDHRVFYVIKIITSGYNYIENLEFEL